MPVTVVVDGGRAVGESCVVASLRDAGEVSQQRTEQGFRIWSAKNGS
jgi:hypothetical protein